MKLGSSTLLFFNTSPRSHHQRTWGDATISSSFNQKSPIVALKPLKSSPISISDFYNVMNGAGGVHHPQASTTFPSSDNLLGTNSLFIDGSLSLVAVLVFCVGLLGLYLQVNRDDSSDLLITADPAIILDDEGGEEESITTAEFDDVDVVEITLDDDDKKFKEQMELEIIEELRAKELSEQLRLKEEEERKIQEQRAAEEEAEAIARAEKEEEERLKKEAAEAEAEAEAIARAEQELQEKLLEEKRLKEEAEAAARAEQELQEKLMEEKRLEEEVKAAAAAALAEENARAEALAEKKNSERQTVDNLISFIRKENTNNVKKEKENSEPEREVMEVENVVPVLSKSNQITQEEEEVVVDKIEDNVKQTTEVVVKLKPKKKVLKSNKSIKMLMKKKSIIFFALFLVLGQRFLQIAVKRFIL